MADLNQIQADLAKLKTEIATIKAWLNLHSWLWYVVAFLGGAFMAKVIL